jgi:hypothetical protein
MFGGEFVSFVIEAPINGRAVPRDLKSQANTDNTDARSAATLRSDHHGIK